MLASTLLYTSARHVGLGAIMNGVIEEKTNRVVEVVVVLGAGPRSCSAGKVLGVGAAGLTQFTVWALTLACPRAPTRRPAPPPAA